MCGDGKKKSDLEFANGVLGGKLCGNSCWSNGIDTFYGPRSRLGGLCEAAAKRFDHAFPVHWHKHGVDKRVARCVHSRHPNRNFLQWKMSYCPEKLERALCVKGASDWCQKRERKIPFVLWTGEFFIYLFIYFWAPAWFVNANFYLQKMLCSIERLWRLSFCHRI